MNKEKNTKKLIEELLMCMGVQYDTVEEREDGLSQKKVFVIQSPESEILIGEHGETFQALTHIIRRIVNKDVQETHLNGGVGQMVDFSIDVNDDRATLLEKLKTKALLLANRAKDMKIDVEFEPMSSYERLIVHGTLSGKPNIKTESIGEGRDRRLIIKYIPN